MKANGFLFIRFIGINQMKGGKMFNNKKGLSAIVTTLIIILLSVVALGVIWGVVSNLVDNSKADIDKNSKCLGVDVTVTSVTDTNSDGSQYSVTVSRKGSGEDEAIGVKVALFNDTANTDTKDFGLTLNPLDTKTNSSIAFAEGNRVIAANKVEITPYFNSESGEEDLCGTKTIEF